MSRLTHVAVATMALAVLAGCMDSNQRLADPVAVEAAAPAGTCELVKDLSSGVRDFFQNPERQSASNLVRDLDTACRAGNGGATAASAWQVLGLMETVLGNGNAGATGAGAALANGLLACTTSLCLPSANPALSLARAFATPGLFAVRRADTRPAIARASAPFTDLQGNPNSVLWGVEVSQPWSVVTGANPVLVYGGLVSQGLVLADLGIASVQYQLDVFPDLGEFLDGSLHVGACFASEIQVPAVGGAERAPGLQREGVLLEVHTPSFCPAPLQLASLAAPFVALAERFLPAALRAVFVRDFGVSVIGGTPLDFSRFAAVAANPNGVLEFVVPPNANVKVGESIGPVRVRARSGSGTPMERVLVTLYVLNNQGVPAGAVLSGDFESYTLERNGMEGIAVFPDNGPPPSLGKPGGYRICARGSLGGFTFTEACSGLINAKM